MGPHADPLRGAMVDERFDGSGVGDWVPRQKHRLLAEYLHGTRAAWRKWPRRTLIDPFCGPGRIRVVGEQQTRDGGAIVAWRELQAAGAPFTQVMVGDLDPAKCDACARRLEALGASVQAFAGPAAETVPEMVAATERGALVLAYVDPFNLRLLDFPTLARLATLKVDLVVHFSTMDLQRNLVKDTAQDPSSFDHVSPGWSERAAGAKLGTKRLRAGFFEHWLEGMKGLGFTAAQAMPLVHNQLGQPIYRLVFFARHDLPLRIWSDVARSPNLDLFG